MQRRMNLCLRLKPENRQPLLEEGSDQKWKIRGAQNGVKLQRIVMQQGNYLRFLLIIKRKTRTSARNVVTMAAVDSCVWISNTNPKNKLILKNN